MVSKFTFVTRENRQLPKNTFENIKGLNGFFTSFSSIMKSRWTRIPRSYSTSKKDLMYFYVVLKVGR